MIRRMLMMATGLAAAMWPRRAAGRGTGPPRPIPKPRPRRVILADEVHIPKARPWARTPRVGDKVDYVSRYGGGKWFPGEVTAIEDGGPTLAIRGLGNPTADGGYRADETRPLSPLAAARRDAVRFPEDYPAWSAYDSHAAGHLGSCPGCPECEGLDGHYPACPDCGKRRHREESGPCLCVKYPWIKERGDSAARLATARRRAARFGPTTYARRPGGTGRA